jgi:hypothetical protein
VTRRQEDQLDTPAGEKKGVAAYEEDVRPLAKPAASWRIQSGFFTAREIFEQRAVSARQPFCFQSDA